MMRQYELVERVQAYNPHADEDLLNRAYVYAMQEHGTQKRASGDPYFAHPLEVAAILTDLKLDDATIAAAVLHDTIEDTDATRAEIDQLFGPEIGEIVDGLTKIKRLELVSKQAAQAENFRKLLLAISADVRVLLVKLADRLHNMRTLALHAGGKARSASPRRRWTSMRRSPAAWACRTCASELEDLAFRKLKPEAYAHDHRAPRRDARRKSEELDRRRSRRELTEKLAAERHRGRRSPAGRSGPGRSGRKMERKQSRFEQLSDMIGFRVIVDDGRRLLPRRSASSTPTGRSCRAASRTTSRPPSRTTTARSTPPSSGRPPARRAADPHRATWTASPNTASPRTPSTRTAGGRPTSRHRGCDESQRLSVAAPDHRAAGRGRQPGGVPRIHQARAVPGPGVLLHAEGPADRPAARRDADRLRLRAPHRHRQHRRRRQDQRPHRAAAARAAERRRGRDHPRRRSTRRRPTGNRSSSPARPAPPSAAPRAPPCGGNMPGSAARSSTAPSSAPARPSRTTSCEAPCRAWPAPRSRTCSRPSGAARCSRATWCGPSIPDYKDERRPRRRRAGRPSTAPAG